MNIDKPKEWSEQEVRLLIKLASERSLSEIAKELGRYVSSVKRVANNRGILLRK